MLPHLRHQIRTTHCIYWSDLGSHGGRYAMSELAIIDSDAFKLIEDVADLHVKGISPYTIARRLSIKVVEAKAAIQQWETIIQNDMDSRDAARDYLNKLVAHYDTLISKAHENLDELDTMTFDEKVSAQRNATMKNIADFEAKRVDLLQKAGLLDAGELGDELAEREEREALDFLEILRNDLCTDCKIHVRDQD